VGGGDEQRLDPPAAPGPHARRQHGLEHLAAACQPPLGHPGGEVEHPRREERRVVLHAGHRLERLLRQVPRPHGHAVGQPHPVAAAERHPHPPPRLDRRRQVLGHEVVERLVDAIRQHDGGDRAPPRVVLDPARLPFEEFALARMLVRHAPE
jgi:hypothetical protein